MFMNAKLRFGFVNKTRQVHGYFGETDEYQDQSKDILNSSLNEDVLSDSDYEEPIEES